MNNKGVTLTELLIVIVIMGIIAAIALVIVDGLVEDARIEADTFNLSTLNEATSNLEEYTSVNDIDTFYGYDTDKSRMELLVESGFLYSTLEPLQSDATYEWNVEDQIWELVGGVVNDTYDETVTVIDFGDTSISDFVDYGAISIDMSRWSTSDEGYLVNSTKGGEARIYSPIELSSYKITVTAKLTEGNRGGYGIFFDTYLKDEEPKKDYGYILQFDRGYGDGAIIVRPRVSGGERSPVVKYSASKYDIIPSVDEDYDWWSSVHTITIEVSNVDEDARQAIFSIDGQVLGSYQYDNEIIGKQIYTGFRGWHSYPTEYYTLTVE